MYTNLYSLSLATTFPCFGKDSYPAKTRQTHHQILVHILSTACRSQQSRYCVSAKPVTDKQDCKFVTMVTSDKLVNKTLKC